LIDSSLATTYFSMVCWPVSHAVTHWAGRDLDPDDWWAAGAGRRSTFDGRSRAGVAYDDYDDFDDRRITRRRTRHSDDSLSGIRERRVDLPGVCLSYSLFSRGAGFGPTCPHRTGCHTSL